jgi:hypothetical protein
MATQVVRDEHEDLKLPDVEEGDRFRNMRKRRLTMAPRVGEKTGQSVEDSIIERGIRDDSINWMVVAATSLRSGVYSNVQKAKRWFWIRKGLWQVWRR